ncbi:DUF4347 domain-containing protein, partial [Alphaproteobacteria bacterium]|nr:DUF4347 domain-containing protein [Alphaproteobacteria bacterium]
MNKRLLLIDEGLSEKHILINNLDNNTDAVLVNGLSFFESISRNLSSGSYDILDIVCHANPTKLIIGERSIRPNDWFNNINPDEFINLREVNFWCCNFASGDESMKFIKELSTFLMTRVNASSQKVGHQDLSGNWNLDVSESPLPPFSNTATSEWRHTLSTADTIANDLTELVSLYNNSTVSSFSLDVDFFTEFGANSAEVLTVEQLMALGSEKLDSSSEALVGGMEFRIVDDASAIIGAFRADLDLTPEFAKLFTSVQANNSSIEDAAGVAVFVDVLNELRDDSGTTAFAFELSSAETLTDITYYEAVLAISTDNLGGTTKSNITSIKDDLESIEQAEFEIGGDFYGVTLIVDGVTFEQVEEVAGLSFVSSFELDANEISGSLEVNVSQAVAANDAINIGDLSLALLTIRDDASEFIDNDAKFDAGYFFSSSSELVSILENTSIAQLTDNSLSGEGWVMDIEVVDDLSAINGADYLGNAADLLGDLKNGVDLSGAKITSVEFTNVTAEQYDSDVEAAISGSSSAVKFQLTEDVTDLIAFINSGVNTANVSEYVVTSGTTASADLGDLLVLVENDVFVSPSFDVAAQTTAAELYEFYNDGPDKVSAVRIADTIEITAGNRVSIDEYNNLKTLESVEFGADSIDISDSAYNVIADQDDIINADVNNVYVDGDWVDATIGVELTKVENALEAESGTSDVNFHVRDSAEAIFAEVSSAANHSALDGANSLMVTGGELSMDGADIVQDIAGYSDAGSEYGIRDLASNILDQTEVAVDPAITNIFVSDPSVEATIGVQLDKLEDDLSAVSFSATSDVHFSVNDSARDIADALMSTGASLQNAEEVVVDGGTVSVSEAADIQSIGNYSAAASDYAIQDSSGAILAAGNYNVVVDSGVEQVFVTDTVSVADGVSLSDMEVALEAERGSDTADIDFDVAGSASDIINNASDLSGASNVYVTSGGESGPDGLVMVDATQGVALGNLEEELKNDDDASGSENVVFGVKDAAEFIAGEISSDPSALSEAEMVIADNDGSMIDIDQAAAIQGLANYNADSSAYGIEDSAADILTAVGKNAVEDSGVSQVFVTDTATVQEGVQLSDLNIALGDVSSTSDAHIDFNVVGTSGEILSAGTDLSGASNIDVNNGPVDALIGVRLDALNESLSANSPNASAHFEATSSPTDYEVSTIDFSVEDTAKNIADELIFEGSSSNLDAAQSVTAIGGIVSVSEAAAIQDIQGFNDYSSNYTIEDSSAAILNDISTASDYGVSQVNVTDTVGVSDGIELSKLEASLDRNFGSVSGDVDFDVVGSASDIIANAFDLSGATTVEVEKDDPELVVYGTYRNGGTYGITAPGGEIAIVLLDADNNVLSSSDTSADISNVFVVSVNNTSSISPQNVYEVNENSGWAFELPIEDFVYSPKGITDIDKLFDTATGQINAAHVRGSLTIRESELIDLGMPSNAGPEAASTYGVVDVADGMALNTLENDLKIDDSNSDVLFSVSDSASAVESALAALDISNAEEIFVDSGQIDIAGAELIQNNANYQENNSSYEINDSASAIINSTGTVFDNGVDDIIVTDAYVDALDGVELTSIASHKIATDGSSSEVQFRVEDDAVAIAQALVGNGDALNGASEVMVTDGTINYSDAVAVQNIAGYDSVGSMYNISDTAGAILSATGDVLRHQGVQDVIVNDINSAADALEINNKPNVTEYNLSASFTDVTGVSIDEALAIVDINGTDLAGNPVDASAVDIIDEIGDIRTAISDGVLGSGNVLEGADVHATVADVADALEIYVGVDTSGVDSQLDDVVTTFELMEDTTGAIDPSVSLSQLTIQEAQAVYDAENSDKIDTISVSDSFGAFDAASSWLKANVNNNIHIEDVTLNQGNQLVSDHDTTYGGLTYTFDLHSTELNGFYIEKSVEDALTFIQAENGPNPQEISILDSWDLIDDAPVLALASVDFVHATGVAIDELAAVDANSYVDEVSFDKGALIDSSFFADLTIDEADLALQYANETDYHSMVDTGNLTIEDTLEQLFGHPELLEFASEYSITTWGGSAYPGDVSDIGELTVEQAGIYYGAANFVSPENATPGPNYTINDTAQAIADGVNSVDANVANGIFAATSVVADGGAPVDMGDAALVQGASDYDASNSGYEISDSSAAILGDTGTVVNAGVSDVTVEDAFVNASDGADLSALEVQLDGVSNNTQSDIVFRVEDSAAAIAAEVTADPTFLNGADD